MFITYLRMKGKFNTFAEKVPYGLKILTFQQGHLLNLEGIVQNENMHPLVQNQEKVISE